MQKTKIMKKTIFILGFIFVFNHAFAVDSNSSKNKQSTNETSIKKKEFQPKLKKGTKRVLKVLKRVKRYVNRIKNKISSDIGDISHLLAALVLMVLGVIIWFTSMPQGLIITLFIIFFLAVSILIIAYLVSLDIY